MKLVDSFFDLTQGRKYRLFYISLLAAMIAYGSTIFSATLSSNLSTILTFISSLYMVYCGGNALSSYALAKGNSTTTTNTNTNTNVRTQ